MTAVVVRFEACGCRFPTVFTASEPVSYLFSMLASPASCAGAAQRPKLELSFRSHDFGPRFVHQAGMAPTVVRLRARNADSQELSFDIG